MKVFAFLVIEGLLLCVLIFLGVLAKKRSRKELLIFTTENKNSMLYCGLFSTLVIIASIVEKPTQETFATAACFITLLILFFLSWFLSETKRKILKNI